MASGPLVSNPLAEVPDDYSPPLITDRYDPKGRAVSEAAKSSAMPS